MQWHLLLGLLFSLNVLYLVTCVFIMMKPEDVSTVDDKETDTHRVESAVIVNSLVIAVLGLMLAARFFSSLGELMVELLYQLISEPDRINHATSNLQRMASSKSRADAAEQHVNLLAAQSSQANVQHTKPVLNLNKY